MVGTLVEDCEHLDHPSTGHTGEKEREREERKKERKKKKSVQNCEQRQSTIWLLSLSQGVCHPFQGRT